MIRSPEFDAFSDRFDRALLAAVQAAAYTYTRAVKTRLMQGYTTGHFSEGAQGVAGTVTVGEVTRTATGASVEVGTNVPYAAYWEFGHQNLFTRKYERVEVWRESLEVSGGAMESAFGAGFTRALEGQSPPSVQFYAAESPYQGPDPLPGFGGFRSGSGVTR